MKSLYNELSSSNDQNIKALQNKNNKLESELKEKHTNLNDLSKQFDNLRKNYDFVCKENNAIKTNSTQQIN